MRFCGAAPIRGGALQETKTVADDHELAALERRLRDRSKSIRERWRSAVGGSAEPHLVLDPQPAIEQIGGTLGGPGDGASRARARERLVEIGWEVGWQRCAADGSLPELVRELSALRRALLEECEAEVNEVDAPAAAGSGIRLALRITDACAALEHAAVGGFVSAQASRMRKHFRRLRHDLLNPIGTVRSAVAMMQDSSVPAPAGGKNRFPDMIARNAGTLATMIGERLSDSAAAASAGIVREVSLRDLALAVRRDLEEIAVGAECEIAVADDLPAARVDPSFVVTVLKSVLGVALARAKPHHRIAVRSGAVRERAVAIAVAFEGADGGGGEPPLAASDLAGAGEIATRGGGRVRVGAAVEIEVPRLPV